jgi:DNA-binding GntR family transcriptional regulator
MHRETHIRSSLRPLAEEPTENANLTRRAYEKIRAAIVFGRFDLGEPLSELELGRALGISKGPVRAALGELQVKGLVEVVPQSGTYVFTATRPRVEALCDFRYVLETTAIRLSMEHSATTVIAEMQKVVTLMIKAAKGGNRLQNKLLDTDFHQAFIRHCRNEYVVSAYETIGHTVEALRYRFLDTVIFQNRAFEEHRQMLQLLEKDKTEKVVAILKDHIGRTKQFQASIDWGSGRARRRDYKFRNYREALEG